MSLNTEEMARAIALGMGSAKPESGFEKHFVWVLAGTALPCSAKEQRWVEYFDQWYCDLVDRRIDEVLQELATAQMADLVVWAEEIRHVERARRRQPLRRRGSRAARPRVGGVGKRGVAPKGRTSRSSSESRRAK